MRSTSPTCATALEVSPSPQLAAALQALPVLRISALHRLHCDARLDAIKGGLWRSVFGVSLHDVDRAAYDALMGPVTHGEDAARSWALRAPDMADEWIPAGAGLPMHITLLGAEAVASAGACVMAIHRMGERGFGSARAQAALVELGFATPGKAPVIQGQAPAWSTALPEQIGTLADAWRAAAGSVQEPASTGLQLRLISPLRVKQQGEMLRAVPTLPLLTQRLLGRLVQLLPQIEGGIFAVGERSELLDLATRCVLMAHDMGGLTWDRYSAKQKRVMPMEGLMGVIGFTSPAASLYPLWTLAQWTQLGAKTTFGFGVVEVDLA